MDHAIAHRGLERRADRNAGSKAGYFSKDQKQGIFPKSREIRGATSGIVVISQSLSTNPPCRDEQRERHEISARGSVKCLRAQGQQS
jgi:hypothetical protein